MIPPYQKFDAVFAQEMQRLETGAHSTWSKRDGPRHQVPQLIGSCLAVTRQDEPKKGEPFKRII